MADKTLNEGKWLSKIKDVFGPKPKYTVELYCFLPFRWNDPVKVKIDDVSSLDDPRIEKAYKAIRAKHPKSPIRLYSPLGNKTFYENSSSEYELRAYDKDSDRVDTFGAGTLPQAMAMCEKMWNVNPDAYKTIEVIHNDEVVTNYNGLEEGFTMNLNAAPDPNDDKNNKQNQDQQQEQPAQVDPDTSTVIKDKNGNDVTVSMSNDADTVSIDGQEINKDELNKAIDQVMKDFKNKEQNQQQEEPEQDQNSEEEQPAEDKENPENDKEEQDNQDNTEKDTAATDDAEQQQEEPESDETTDSQTENEEDYRLSKEENDYYKAKNKLGRKGEYALNKKLSDYDREVEKQNAEYNAQMDAERKEKQLAADREMKDFEVQQDREKRDADLEAEREKSLERKSYKDNGGQSFLNKMLNTNTAKHLAAAGLTGLTGGALAPMFAKGITDHGIDRINNYNKETERINKAKKDFDQKAEKNKKLDKAADERLKAKRDLEDKQRNDNKSSAVAYKRQDAQRAADQKQQRAELEKDITKKLANKYGYNKNYDIKRDIATAAKKREMMNAARKKNAEPTDKQKSNSKITDTINAKKNNSKSSKFARNTMKGFKHESLTEAELQHSWVDQDKDICNIDEFITLAKNGIHPALADTRRPKWHNVLTDNTADRKTTVYVDGEPRSLEILIVLDGVDQIEKDGKTKDVAIIKEKIPVGINPSSGNPIYKDGNRYRVSFNQFKKILNHPENEETLSKFEKTHPDDPELILHLYEQAKQNMDEMYPSWENAYWDDYNLKNYTATERGNMYLRWKEVLEGTNGENGHEMTVEEINHEFAFPKLQQKLKQVGSLNSKLDQQAVDNLLKQLPADKADDLLNQLEKTLEDCYYLDMNETQKKMGEFMLTTPASLACENLINKMTGNALDKLEKKVSEESQDDFDDDKEKILNKYIVKANIHGTQRAMADPRIVSRKNEILKDLENLRKKYNVSIWSIDVDEIRKNAEELKAKFLNPPKIQHQYYIPKTSDQLAKDLEKADDEYIAALGKNDSFENWKKLNTSITKDPAFADKNGNILDPKLYNYSGATVYKTLDYIKNQKARDQLTKDLEKAKKEYKKIKKEFDDFFGEIHWNDNYDTDNEKYNRTAELNAALIDYSGKTFEINPKYFDENGKLDVDIIMDDLANSMSSNRKEFTPEDVEALQRVLDLKKAKNNLSDLYIMNNNNIHTDEKPLSLRSKYPDIKDNDEKTFNANVYAWAEKIKQGDIKIIDNALEHIHIPTKHNYVSYLKQKHRPKNTTHTQSKVRYGNEDDITLYDLININHIQSALNTLKYSNAEAYEKYDSEFRDMINRLNQEHPEFIDAYYASKDASEALDQAKERREANKISQEELDNIQNEYDSSIEDFDKMTSDVRDEIDKWYDEILKPNLPTSKHKVNTSVDKKIRDYIIGNADNSKKSED